MWLEEGDNVVVNARLQHMLFQCDKLLTEAVELKANLMAFVVLQFNGGQNFLPLV